MGVSSVLWCHLELLLLGAPCLQLVLPSARLSTEPGGSLPFASSSGACWLNTQSRANTSLGGALLSPTALYKQVLFLDSGAVLTSPIKPEHLISLVLMPPWHHKHPVWLPSPAAAARVDLGG